MKKQRSTLTEQNELDEFTEYCEEKSETECDDDSECKSVEALQHSSAQFQKRKRKDKERKKRQKCANPKIVTSEKSSKKSFYDAFDNLLPTQHCGVCDEMKSKSDMKPTSIPITWEKFMLLQQSDECSPVLNTTCIKDNHINICKTCYQNLSCGQIPNASILNNAWGDVPPELACLNALEEKMIALYVCNTKIVICPLGQTARIGGTAYVMNDLVSNVEVLPRMPNMTDTLLAVPRKYNNQNTKSDGMMIRPNLIKRALLWLIEHNPLYKQAHALRGQN